MTILEAIKIAQKGKYDTPNVVYHGNRVTWDQDKDTKFQEYKKARNLISEHKFIESVLLKLGII